MIDRYQPFSGKCCLHYQNGRQIPNPPAVSFTKARVKERIRYYFWDQLFPEANSFKYLEIITRSDLNWADHVSYILRKAWMTLRFVMRMLKKRGGKNEMFSSYDTSDTDT